MINKRSQKSYKEIEFHVSPRDLVLVRQIVLRAIREFKALGYTLNTQEVEMDVSAVHANCHPLRLDELLVADEFKFMHDMAGIRKHLNRETGKLEDGFSPRYSVPAVPIQS